MQDKIIKAARELKRISISYVDKKGASSVRVVEPYELKDGKLFAYCVSKGGIRAFKLDGITRVESTSQSYIPQWPVQI